MRHILTAMIMPEHQAPSDVVRKRPAGRADALADRLQRLKPGPLLRRMDTHTLGRAMIDRDKDCHLALLPGARAGHISPPHRTTCAVMIVPSGACGPWGCP